MFGIPVALMMMMAGLPAGTDKPVDPQPADPLRVAMGMKKPTRVRVACNQTTVIRLPEGQRVMNVWGGDKGEGGLWGEDAGKSPSRFLSVKPKDTGIHTTLTVVSDTGEELALYLDEVTGQDGQFDAQVDATSTQSHSNSSALPEQPAVKWVPADEVASCKSAAGAARTEAAEATKKAKAQVDSAEAAYQASYPDTLVYGYTWDDAKKADRLGLSIGWHDNKFTYFRGSRVLALYEIDEDGKPSLIQYSYKNGLYIISKVIYDGYFAIGPKDQNKVKFHLPRSGGKG
jgi:type IV secretory pathway VirB9-like protein